MVSYSRFISRVHVHLFVVVLESEPMLGLMRVRAPFGNYFIILVRFLDILLYPINL